MPLLITHNGGSVEGQLWKLLIGIGIVCVSSLNIGGRYC